jgi:cytochrome b
MMADPIMNNPLPNPSRLVIDAPMRMFHALFALSFCGAYITADIEDWRRVHVVLGYTLAGMLAFRLVYGLVGPRPARLSTLWRKSSGTWVWLQTVKAGLSKGGDMQAVAWPQGPIWLMAATLTTLLFLVLPLTLSGYGAFQEWGGDVGVEVFEALHEFFGNTALALVLAHLALLAGQSVWRQKNLALPMLTGRIEGKGPDLVPGNRTWLAALLLLSVLGYWAWEVYSAWNLKAELF